MSAPALHQAIAALDAALDSLLAIDPADLADEAAVTLVHRHLARLEALGCRQAAAVHRARPWRDAGPATAPAWVASTCRVRKQGAQRRLRLGRFLDGVDRGPVAAAFAAGSLSIDHVDVLARAGGRAGSFHWNRDLQQLLCWAETLPFEEFRRRVETWLLEVDPDGAEDRAAKVHEQRRLHLSQSFENLWFFDAVLDPIGGELVHEALRRIERELFEEDWARTKTVIGREPSGEELAAHTRRPAQRRADALVELARRANAVPAGARAPRPLFTVLVGEESFARTCELASGAIVAPGALARWLDRAMIERIVFDGPDRVRSVSRRRTFEGALRRAIQVVDRRCSHPTCDRPAHECEVDHIEPWAAGGSTSFSNGRLLCGFHNRRRHGPRNGPQRTPPRPQPPDRGSEE